MFTFNFNGPRSAIHLNFSPINNGYIVYRSDGPNEGNVRIHNTLDEALDDYNSRVEFIKKMEAA